MDFHGTKCKLFPIYVVMGLRVAILRFLCKKIVKIIAKKSVFAMEKVLLHKNLKIATLRPITT